MLSGKKMAASSRVRRYGLAFYLQSTALVMPVLPIWWTSEIGIPVPTFLSALALAAVLPIILDFPLSLWADLKHPRLPYAIGLFVFSFGFFATAFIASPVGFWCYIVAIALASALISGANHALLLHIVGQDAFAGVLYRLNHRFYLFTAALFLVGVGIYTVSPRALFIVQALSLLVAAVLVCSLRGQEELVATDASAPSRWRELIHWPIIQTVVGLAVLGAVFDGVTQFQNRSFQILSYQSESLAELSSSSKLWFSAVVLVAANVFASLGLSKRAYSQLKGRKTSIVVIGLGLLAMLALAGFVWGSATGLIVGVLVFSVLKGVYRPFLADLISRSIPLPGWKARWFSIVGVVTGVFAAVFNAGFALISEDAPAVALLWLSAVVVLVLVISLRGLVFRGV